MWTQTWTIANIQQLDREGRMIIVENGGITPRDRQRYCTCLGNSVEEVSKSVENEYKNSKIKVAVELY